MPPISHVDFLDNRWPKRNKTIKIKTDRKTTTIKYPPLCITESEAQAQRLNSANPMPLRIRFFAKIAAKPIPITGVSQGQSQLGFATTPIPRTTLKFLKTKLYPVKLKFGS